MLTMRVLQHILAHLEVPMEESLGTLLTRALVIVRVLLLDEAMERPGMLRTRVLE